MSLESFNFIDSLNASNPTTTDNVSEGDDHIRGIKSTLKTTFPSINAAITATDEEINLLDGVTATTAELNTLDGITATTAELNVVDGITATVAELNILDGVTSTAAELNVLDGITSTVTELNYTDGVTSAIQTQLGTKLPLTGGTMTGDLTVEGDVKPERVIITETDSSTVAVRLASDLDEGFLQAWADGAQKVQIRTNGASYFNGGNVGIGTSSPAKPLDVTGDIRTSTGILFGTDTAAANALDDYEQGTFTPYWNAGSQTNASYSAQAGNYTKIGNRVHVQGRIVVTSLGSLSGGLRLYGLPFTTLGSYSSISIGRATGLAIPANATISGFSELGATFCDMTIWETSVGTNTMLASDLSADGDIMFALDYLST